MIQQKLQNDGNQNDQEKIEIIVWNFTTSKCIVHSLAAKHFVKTLFNFLNYWKNFANNVKIVKMVNVRKTREKLKKYTVMFKFDKKQNVTKCNKM